MNSTRMPPSISQSMLMLTRFFSVWEATSPTDGSAVFELPGGGLVTRCEVSVPVCEPSRSPLAANAAPLTAPTTSNDETAKTAR